jgi:hypothetical protein
MAHQAKTNFENPYRPVALLDATRYNTYNQTSPNSGQWQE